MPWDYEPVKKTYSINSLHHVENEKTYKTPHVQSKICQQCGYDFNDFIKTGYLGCPECYRNFKQELEPYLNELK